MTPAWRRLAGRVACGLALLSGLWFGASAVASSGGAAVADKPAARQASGSAFTRVLRPGDSGSDVTTLQRWLTQLGYPVPATGYFGTETKSATRSFQVAHRLYPASGTVGVRTAGALLAAITKPASGSTTGSSTDSAETDPAGLDPIPGFVIDRDDMGVDAIAHTGAPIYAPLASKLVQVMQEWYAGEPLLLFQLDSPPSDALSDYWYVAEQIVPVTTRVGASFGAGQEVATFAASGTGIEIGWGSPTSNARTLADVTDPAAASPPFGSKTVWGESFKQAFRIP